MRDTSKGKNIKKRFTWCFILVISWSLCSVVTLNESRCCCFTFSYRSSFCCWDRGCRSCFFLLNIFTSWSNSLVSSARTIACAMTSVWLRFKCNFYCYCYFQLKAKEKKKHKQCSSWCFHKKRLSRFCQIQIFTARIRRMGKVMFSVYSHLGGYPYPIMLCNISQNAMGQTLGGYPARSSRGGTLLEGYPAGGVPGGYPAGVYPAGGGYPAGGYPGQVPLPGQVRTGVPCPGGYPGRTREGVLNTQRAVCLLRSRRRTFL